MGGQTALRRGSNNRDYRLSLDLIFSFIIPIWVTFFYWEFVCNSTRRLEDDWVNSFMTQALKELMFVKGYIGVLFSIKSIISTMWVDPPKLHSTLWIGSYSIIYPVSISIIPDSQKWQRKWWGIVRMGDGVLWKVCISKRHNCSNAEQGAFLSAFPSFSRIVQGVHIL